MVEQQELTYPYSLRELVHVVRQHASAPAVLTWVYINYPTEHNRTNIDAQLQCLIPLGAYVEEHRYYPDGQYRGVEGPVWRFIHFGSPVARRGDGALLLRGVPHTTAALELLRCHSLVAVDCRQNDDHADYDDRGFWLVQVTGPGDAEGHLEVQDFQRGEDDVYRRQDSFWQAQLSGFVPVDVRWRRVADGELDVRNAAEIEAANAT